MKILIIGAGPTGLTAALEFARQGIVPEIVDAKNEPSPFSRAVGVLPNSIHILNRTGVGQKIVEEGVAFERVTIHRGEEVLIDMDITDFLDEENFVIGLPQDRTEALMSERLEEMGVPVRYSTRVENVEAGEASATVTFANGEVKEYDWVLGCDGVLSTTRKALSIPYEGYELSEEWSIADIELDGVAAPHVRAWLLQSERDERDALVMVPMAKNRVRLVSSTPDSLAALPIELDIKNVRRSGTFKISVRNAKQYVKDRVLLAGDAAHAHSPVGGRGMNVGIEDAEAAVQAILNDTTERYERERKKVAKGVIRGTEFARKTLVSNNLAVHLGLKIVAWALAHSKTLQRRFATKLAEL